MGLIGTEKVMNIRDTAATMGKVLSVQAVVLNMRKLSDDN